MKALITGSLRYWWLSKTIERSVPITFMRRRLSSYEYAALQVGPAIKPPCRIEGVMIGRMVLKARDKARCVVLDNKAEELCTH
jgi:hypothetical protein